MRKLTFESWKYFDEFRGKAFKGQWPTLAELVDINYIKVTDKIGFECYYPEHEQYTYKEIYNIVRDIAAYLYELGVRKGDCVAVTGKNSPQWAFAYLAIVYIGAVVAPIDWSLTDEEIEHLADFVSVKGIFVDKERYDRIGKDEKYGFKFALEEITSLHPTVPYELQKEISSPESSDIAAYLFTSGTTGTPKAVMLTHDNFVINAIQAQHYLPVSDREVFYAILPIHHAFTMLSVFIENFMLNAKLVFGKKLVTKQMLSDMKTAKVTMFMGVPMLFNKIITSMMKGIREKGPVVYGLVRFMMVICGFIKKHTGLNPGKHIFKGILAKVSLDNINVCISGGGPLPVSTFKLFNQFGIDFVQGYGLTETSPILTLNPGNNYNVKSIGKVLPDTEMIFCNKDSQGNGEIAVKGPQVMKGYYKNPEATAQIIDENGFLHTGDIGYIDKNGFVYITGRAKNIIVTDGGKNVFPEEIEDHFQLYEDIEQLCIVGYKVSSDSSAEQVCALIYPSSGAQRKYATDEAMQQHMEEICEEVNKEILPYKRIRKVRIVPEPMEITSTKKIKRFSVLTKYKDLINN